MLFPVTNRPHTGPIKKLNDANEWDSPYSWPVRREFSRILHRPRPHFGIVYTERFLNSRPLTYFDDETKLIRAKAGAILKAVHTPVPKPSKILRPYETLDSYRSYQLIPYGVPQHLYVQSHYNQPAHLTIGRGHLACIQYAGGKGYPRRKNLYSDENRNIRDEIKFRSYYNRPKHEDPNTLPTGFAWRLLHFPPKDDKPFKLYKHSRTLPLTESSKLEEKSSLNEDKENRPIKRIHKTYTQPLNEIPKNESSNVFSLSKNSVNDQPIEKYSKIKDEIIDKPPVVEAQVDEEPMNMVQKTPTDEIQSTEEKFIEEEISKAIGKKNKKKKDDDFVENAHKRSICHSKSVSEETPAEKLENNEIINTSNHESTETKIVPEPHEEIIQENKSETQQETPVAEELTEETPTAEVVTEETKIDSMVDICKSEDDKSNIAEDIKTAELEQVTEDLNSCNEPQEAVVEPVTEQQPPVETMVEVKDDVAEHTEEKSDVERSLEMDYKVVEDDSTYPDTLEVTQEEKVSNSGCDDLNISECAAENEPSDNPVKPDSETAQENDNTKQDETDHVECSPSEVESEVQNRDDSEQSLVTELQIETQAVNQVTEISSTQITQSSEETLVQTYSSTQISQVTEDSDKPEDLVNETDITTYEENVEISME